MAENLKIRITSREVVKPSTPTPAHLSRYSLSHLDQLTDDSYIPLCWLFSGSAGWVHRFPEKCRELKSSLAETLSVYYPVAGRIRDRFTVDCCDAGVEFVEAELNCTMSRISGSPDPHLLKILVPVETGPIMKWDRNTDQFLCVVQVTLLECGGVAVSISITHRVADAATYGGFVKAWGKIAMRSGLVIPIPSKGLAQILPPCRALVEKPSIVNNLVSIGHSVTRRFVFSAAKIEELKAQASSNEVLRPSRAETVTALLWKCAVSSSRLVNGRSSRRQTAASVPIDLRRRLPAILPENTIGNLLVAGFATCEMDHDTDTNTNVADLVVAMRKAVKSVNDRLNHIGKRRDDAKEIISSLSFEAVTTEVMKKMGSWDDCFYIITSSLSGLIPTNLDLGLGPSEGPLPLMMIKNMIALVYTADMRGLHAWVTLGKQEMEIFEKDKHLLSFAATAPISINNYSTVDILLQSNL